MRMLGALLLHRQPQYGSNELIAIGGSGYGRGKRILEDFERSSIVIKTARGNQRLYAANTKHPIYPELRSICLKTFGIADRITEELAPFKDRISLACVFGSIAQATDRADSDIDLMFVGSVDLFDLGEAIERLQKSLGKDVDLNLHTEGEWETLHDAHVITAIMEAERIIVISR